MTELILPESGHQAVQRGRDAARRLADYVQEYRARGDEVLEVRVSTDVANDMRCFFAVAFAEFDGVLPSRVLGVPFAEGGTGGRDYSIHLRSRGRVEH